MSGGYFNYNDYSELSSVWKDEEMNELLYDLFYGADFSIRGYSGLFQTLDFWLSSDICEETYRRKVAEFKAKWMRRTPSDRVEFYQSKIQAYADKCIAEFGERVNGE